MASQVYSGFVFNNAGTAVEGATVELFPRNTTATATTSTTTNSSGYWTMSTSTEGRFDVRITNGTSVRFLKYDDEIQVTTLEVANLNIRNPADTFDYSILPAAIAADRTLTLPLITGTDTLATLGLAATFSAVMTHSADIILQNDVDLAVGTGSDGLVRLSTANTGGGGTFAAEDFVIALDDASQSLHITDKAAVGTDWALDDVTHPTVFIHSNTTPATDFISIGGHDGTTADIDVQGGTTLTLSIAGTPQATITAAVLNIPTGNTYQINGADVLSETTLDVGVAGSSTGLVKLDGATSGTVTITVAAAAGTYTLTLPTDDGGANEFLQTNGSGVLSWASTGGALTREGGNTTEATTTSTSVTDLLTASSLTLAAAEPAMILHGLRKTSGATNDVRCGLTLNSTITFPGGSGGVTSTVDRAEDATVDYLLQARVSNYVGGFRRFTNCYAGGTTFAKFQHGETTALSNALVTVEITAVIVTGLVDDASITMGADSLHVYSLAAA